MVLLVDETDEIGIQADQNIICSGFKLERLETLDLFRQFALTALPDSIMLECKVFHHVSCQRNKYRLNIDAEVCNKECREIKDMPEFMKLVAKMDDDTLFQSTEHHDQLSFQQLGQRVSNYRNQLRKAQLSTLNLLKKYNVVSKTLNLHQRLLILLKENDVPRLRALISVALTSKRSIRCHSTDNQCD